MADDREEAIRRLAYWQWESEGRPEGQHEWHWQESEAGIPRRVSSKPQTSQPGEDGHVRSSGAGYDENAPDAQDSLNEDGEGSSLIEEPTAVPPGGVQRPER